MTCPASVSGVYGFPCLSPSAFYVCAFLFFGGESDTAWSGRKDLWVLVTISPKFLAAMICLPLLDRGRS